MSYSGFVAMGTREGGLVGNYGEMEEQNQKLESLQDGPYDVSMSGQMKRLLWHGGSVWDAWFSAASNQVIPFTMLSSNAFSLPFPTTHFAVVSNEIACIRFRVVLPLFQRSPISVHHVNVLGRIESASAQVVCESCESLNATSVGKILWCL